MPTSFPFEVIGSPEILYFFITAMASWIRCSGDMVIGLTIIPLSDRLTLIHFLGLSFDRQVLMDNPHATLLGHGNGHSGVRHRIHRGAQQRNVQT